MAEQVDVSKAVEGIGKVFRSASAQLIEQVESVKEAAKETVDKMALRS